MITGEDSPMSHLLLSVMEAFAHFERDLIRERQREGIALAKLRDGAYVGREHCLNPAQAKDLRRRVSARESKTALAGGLGISRQTLYTCVVARRYISPERDLTCAAGKREYFYGGFRQKTDNKAR